MNNGGELCYRCKVREITHSDGRVTGVRIRDGREIRAPHVLSSAGLFETGQLAGMQMGAPGDISLFQVASCYDVPLAELGIQDSVHFLSRSEPLTWKFRTPAESLQVITFSAQDSYVFDSAKHQFKISCFDHADHWMSLPRSTYRGRKTAALSSAHLRVKSTKDSIIGSPSTRIHFHRRPSEGTPHTPTEHCMAEG